MYIPVKLKELGHYKAYHYSRYVGLWQFPPENAWISLFRYIYIYILAAFCYIAVIIVCTAWSLNVIEYIYLCKCDKKAIEWISIYLRCWSSWNFINHFSITIPLVGASYVLKIDVYCGLYVYFTNTLLYKLISKRYWIYHKWGE